MDTSSPTTRKMTLNSVPNDLIDAIDDYLSSQRKRGENLSRERLIIRALSGIFLPDGRTDITDVGEENL